VKVIRRNEHPQQQLTNSRRPFPATSSFSMKKALEWPTFRSKPDQTAGSRGSSRRSAGDALHGKGPVHERLRCDGAGRRRDSGRPQREADKLLEAGKSVCSQVKMTRREEEVLSGLMKKPGQQGNCRKLNLSERTVKFHVSSLLAKFRVRGRMELVREASGKRAGRWQCPWRRGRHARFRQWRGIIPRAAGGIGCSAGQAAIDGLIRISFFF